MKFIYVLLVAAIALGSCKKKGSKIDQNKIFQSYEVSYNAGTNTTTFYARFYENNDGGAPVMLAESSYVTVNGEELNRNGSVYGFSVAGEVDLATFIFRDANGKKYVNVLSNEESISNDNLSTIDNNTTTNWEFGGNALGVGETVAVSIESLETNGGNSTSSSTVLGASLVEITATDMATLLPGNARVSTTRSSSMLSGNWADAGGKKKSVYISATNSITIN